MKKAKKLGEVTEKSLIDILNIFIPDGEWMTQKRFYYDPNNKRRF